MMDWVDPKTALAVFGVYTLVITGVAIWLLCYMAATDARTDGDGTAGGEGDH